jgi:serine/threonine protein kinase
MAAFQSEHTDSQANSIVPFLQLQYVEYLLVRDPNNHRLYVSLAQALKSRPSESITVNELLSRSEVLIHALISYGILDLEGDASFLTKLEQVRSQVSIDSNYQNGDMDTNVKTLMDYILENVILELLKAQTYPHPSIERFFDKIHIRNPNETMVLDVGKPIGKGGFGEVYQSMIRNDQSQTLYALKQIDTHKCARKARDIASFAVHLHREIFNWREIRSPYVVRYMDHFSERPKAGSLPTHRDIVVDDFKRSRVFIIMEYAPMDLYRAITTPAYGLTPDEVRVGLAQVGRALVHLHTCNIIHRDIKPENISCERRSDGMYMKLFDFGLSKMIGDTPSTMGITLGIGTEDYQAPEVSIRGSTHGKQVDIYALGMTLAVGFGKEFPVFNNFNVPARQRTPSSPREIDFGYCNRPRGAGNAIIPVPESEEAEPTWANVPQEVKDCISRMTRFDPTERYRSIEEVLLDPVWGDMMLSETEAQELHQLATQDLHGLSNYDPADSSIF